MPYRRLPNTDQARIRSLETAINKMRNSDYYAPVLPPDLFNRAETKLQQFKGAVERYVKSLESQVNYSKSDAYQDRLKNAKMYVSHFLTATDIQGLPPARRTALPLSLERISPTYFDLS